MNERQKHIDVIHIAAGREIMEGWSWRAEELRAAADYIKRTSWVSVDDRLPEHRHGVLTIDNGGYTTIAYCSSGRWFDEHGEVKNVTHWMEILEPPVDDENTEA